MGGANGTSINTKPSDMHVEERDEKKRQYNRRWGVMRQRDRKNQERNTVAI